MIRIGVNALYLIPGGVGGTEIYLRNALDALAHEDQINDYYVFRNRETDAELTPASPNFHDCPQPVPGSSRPLRLLHEQTVLPFVCARLRLDVLFNAGFTAPLAAPCPMVTVFHDLQYKRHPEFFRKWELPFWQLLLPASARRSRRLVVLSETVKRDLIELYRLTPYRIAVTPHAVDRQFFAIGEDRDREPPQSKLLLCVSTLHPHKNLDRLLAVFAEFRSRAPEWQLTLVGLKGYDGERIERLRADLGLEAAVTLTGWIERSKLYDLFRRAETFIYPSRFEGFGIPVLEALAAGVPVACSRLPSLQEIAGDTVRYFEPDDSDGMLEALVDVCASSEAREQRRVSGRRRATQYSAGNAARQLIDVFYEAARSKKRHD